MEALNPQMYLATRSCAAPASSSICGAHGIVGGHDREVLTLNRRALTQLTCVARLEIVPGTTHLFEEPADRLPGPGGESLERI